MTKQTGNCFASAYHELVAQRDKMSAGAYNVLYASLLVVYEEKLGGVR